MGSPPLTRRRHRVTGRDAVPPGHLGQSLGPMETFRIQLMCDAGGSGKCHRLLW